MTRSAQGAKSRRKSSEIRLIGSGVAEVVVEAPNASTRSERRSGHGMDRRSGDRTRLCRDPFEGTWLPQPGILGAPASPPRCAAVRVDDLLSGRHWTFSESIDPADSRGVVSIDLSGAGRR
jgi:hypothetical protein